MIVFELKSKAVAHQWLLSAREDSVGLRGIMSKSKELSGMFRIADIRSTLSIIGAGQG